MKSAARCRSSSGLKAATLEELARFLSLESGMARVALNDLIEEGRVLTYHEEYRLAPSALNDFDGHGSMLAAANMVQKKISPLPSSSPAWRPYAAALSSERVFEIKAMQEVIAAKAFQGAHHAAVVSNVSYTLAARQLAATTGVLLLHHSDLP